MKNIYGDMWHLLGSVDAICVTTNGFIKNNGNAVMGRGCARQAARKFPGIAEILGDSLQEWGNHCYVLHEHLETAIVSFPVKHNWWEDADLNLIVQSCHEITDLANEHNWETIVIPRPGCGNGKLKYSDVEPVLSALLDDRFLIVSFQQK